jgi:hypothetical protein
MNVLIKNIRKLMGWCPNAKMLETQHSIHSEYFEANDQAKGRDDENLPVLPTGWWNRRHNRVLMVSSGLTLFPIFGIGFMGVSFRDETFILGLITGTIFNLLLCIWDWYFLNKIKSFSKRVQTKNKLGILGGIFGLTVLLIYSSLLGWRVILTFISGFCLTAFLYYLKDVYWEKKNKKIILLEGYYMPEIYIVNS